MLLLKSRIRNRASAPRMNHGFPRCRHFVPNFVLENAVSPSGCPVMRKAALWPRYGARALPLPQ